MSARLLALRHLCFIALFGKSGKNRRVFPPPSTFNHADHDLEGLLECVSGHLPDGRRQTAVNSATDDACVEAKGSPKRKQSVAAGQVWPEGQQEEKRLRILHCATTAFLAHGYAGANLEDIAIGAGISKVTIYRYFSDKAALFEAVITSASRDMGESLGGLLPADRPLEETLERFALRFITRMLSPVVANYPFYELARVLVGATHLHRGLRESCLAIFACNIGQPLSAFFAKKIAQGELSGGPPEFLALHFAQMLFFTNAVALDPSLLPKEAEIAELARQKVKLFLHGAAAC